MMEMYTLNLWMLFIFLLMFSVNCFFTDQSYLGYWQLAVMNSSNMEFEILIDMNSCLFASLVLFISSNIYFYSNEYMNKVDMSRFKFILAMFIFSMMLMIFSTNLLCILLGWDGLGLSSFCLVIFYQNYSSFNSGMITVISNRIGDVFIILSISILMTSGSWNSKYFSKDIWILLMLASFTKSAQLPFSSWLPKAMAAPTPISSLVHSSTLVTAGIYLIIRFNIFDEANSVIFLISSMTMLMAGMNANFEWDLKKIIALSTLSQIALMFCILSMGNMKLAFFHLIVHATFKSILFMCCGEIIHSMMDIQDIRMLGMVKYKMPLVSIMFCISKFSLCGMPFFSGFYSKDLIMEVMFMSKSSFMGMLMLLMSTILTVSYSFRLVFTMFLTKGKNSINNDLSYMHMMELSMYFLLIDSTIVGFLYLLMFFSTIQLIILPMYLKTLMLKMIIMGNFVGIMFSNMKFSKMIFTNMLNLDNLNSLFTKYMEIKMFLLKNFDLGLLNSITSNLFLNNFELTSNFFLYFFKLKHTIFLTWVTIMIVYLMNI